MPCRPASAKSCSSKPCGATCRLQLPFSTVSPTRLTKARRAVTGSKIRTRSSANSSSACTPRTPCVRWRRSTSAMESSFRSLTAARARSAIRLPTSLICKSKRRSVQLPTPTARAKAEFNKPGPVRGPVFHIMFNARDCVPRRILLCLPQNTVR